MSYVRPVVALGTRGFGRGPTWLVDAPKAVSTPISGDLKLFATTFLAGFVFVSMLLT